MVTFHSVKYGKNFALLVAISVAAWAGVGDIAIHQHTSKCGRSFLGVTTYNLLF